MAVDVITAEIVRARLESIAREMDAIMLRSAYSSIVKEAHDAAAAIYDLDGRIIAQAIGVTGHLGMLLPTVRSLLRAFPPARMEPGDVYLVNDPYHGASHLPDFTVMMPVFHGGAPVAVVASMAHMQDVGGKEAGSTPPDVREIFAEGLRIPPVRLKSRAGWNETLLALLELNVRIPETVAGDLRAQVACCQRGVDRTEELLAEIGGESLAGIVDEFTRQSEALTRMEIAELDDGSYHYEDYVDDDGVALGEPLRISVCVTVAGSTLTVDFEGTSPQTAGPINCPASGTQAAVYYVIRSVIDSSIPDNDGCYRPIEIRMPEGSLVNPVAPAPVGIRAVVMKRIVDTLYGALAAAMPARIPAASSGQLAIMYVGGKRADGSGYVGFVGVPWPGGMGARPGKDGLDVVSTDVENSLSFPVEACETTLPLRYHGLRLWTDSGGAGLHRGGLGYHAVYEWLGEETSMTHRRDRHSLGPWGMGAAAAAPRCRTVIVRADGSREAVASKAVVPVRAGDMVHVYSTGGGGWGDPLERDPQRVLADVLEGRVSPAAARARYGVALRYPAAAAEAGSDGR